MPLYNDISEAIGLTPLVKLQRIGSYIPANLWAKCEYMNPGGSTKDRIAEAMIDRAEQEGKLRKGDTIIEATSGNTGLGLALVGAARGYKVIITMPEKMSHEKQVVLEALGAKIIRTPTEAAYDDPESHISVARRLCDTTPRAHLLDQYTNEANPQAHYKGTAREIYDDLGGQVDMVVAGVGTGGSITGIAQAFKELAPKCVIVAVDPHGSILDPTEENPELAPYHVEGIGYDFVPDVLQRDLVHRWVKTSDRESFAAALRLIREEGLLCGGSSGAAMCGALKEAPTLQAGQNCVIILSDGVRNYLSKFLSPQWLQDHQLS